MYLSLNKKERFMVLWQTSFWYLRNNIVFIKKMPHIIKNIISRYIIVEQDIFNTIKTLTDNEIFFKNFRSFAVHCHTICTGAK